MLRRTLLLVAGLVRAAAARNLTRARDNRRGYDSDFDWFMSKMFSQMPQGKATIALEKQGPNMGYLPYWYGYSFMREKLKPQKLQWGPATQDWDSGLQGANGKDIWRGNLKVLLGGETGQLGLGAAFFDAGDLVGGARPPSLNPNMGPTGVLGSAPEDFTDSALEALKQTTLDCLPCSQEDKAIGPVCVMDTRNNIIEMERCAFLRANCLRGTAYYTATYESEYEQWWFPLQDEWARFSVRGKNGKAHILLSEDIKWTASMDSKVPSYLIAIDPDTYDRKKYTYMYKDNTFVVASYQQGMYSDNWTEYSIVWNSDNGWFLMSQPRREDYTQYNHIEYVDPRPFEIKYFAACTWWGSKYGSEWIIHDLTLVNNGPCTMGGVVELPEDTRELLENVDRKEKQFNDRMKALKEKKIDVNSSLWLAQEGSAAEY